MATHSKKAKRKLSCKISPLATTNARFRQCQSNTFSRALMKVVGLLVKGALSILGGFYFLQKYGNTFLSQFCPDNSNPTDNLR